MNDRSGVSPQSAAAAREDDGADAEPTRALAVQAPYKVPDAACYLGVERKRVLELANTGELPGARIGKAWIFDPRDVHEFRAQQIAKQTAQRRVANTSVGSLDSRPRWSGRRRPLPVLPAIPKRRGHGQ